MKTKSDKNRKQIQNSDQASEANCWKTIGVWGQSERMRCPALAKVIHCRNCEVFTQAGRNLLERDLSATYQNEWTLVLSEEKEEVLPDTIAAVIFRIGDEWLALPAKLFEEVIDPERPHQVPHRHNPVLMGVINVHGEIQLCVSLQKLLGIEELKNHQFQRNVYQRMIMVNSESGYWVFPADEIYGIVRIHPQIFQNAPVTVSKDKAAFTKALFQWNDKEVAFLDDELLFYYLNKSVCKPERLKSTVE
ncbi:chemotaxis protein CheW [Desulfococcaceae bacterium HSG9]|nr:chemotaxis protein CheW [Desulfococcaceae bacterium HSG9]